MQLHSNSFLTPEEEKARYELHENNVTDPGYQEFVAPTVKAVLKNHDRSHQGLDFGCGTGPVITKLLQDKEYSIRTYDPYFKRDADALEQNYAYIVCCEVMEHFRDPHKEFRLLRSLLKPNGKLYCQTDIYTEETDFPSWYYKNDPTHIFFYHPDTLQWIATQIGFSDVDQQERLITFHASAH